MESIATPVIVVDEQTVDSNLQRMADYVAKHNLKLRPHIKTHKSNFRHGQSGCSRSQLLLCHPLGFVRFNVWP